MHPPFRIACVVVALTVSTVARATVDIDYVFTSESTQAGRPPRSGENRLHATIDGAHFRNVGGRGQVETSDDDGTTTYFGDGHDGQPQSPLIAPVAPPWAPIVGTIEDEQLVLGESRPGPSMFGLATRVYTIDYRYTITARVGYVVRTHMPNHDRYTVTVVDNGVSSAAFRVAFSRGHGHAICQHPEAFTGLPLAIEGTLESGDPVAITSRVSAKAVSLDTH